MSETHVWFVWSGSFLVPWLLLYLALPCHRRPMWWASVFTMPFGITERFFVPTYWSPPSLFDLARRTGFDIESFIFSFAIGGLAAVLYDIVTRRTDRPMSRDEMDRPRHRLHRLALAVPPLVFPPLYLLPWNPIYPAIIAMAAGAAATVLCRPDLGRKTALGALLFLVLYAVWLTGLEVTAPDYIERVWNLAALSGVTIAYMPLEELLFALAFGAYWSSIYEHANFRIGARTGSVSDRPVGGRENHRAH